MAKAEAFFGFWKSEDLENINITLEDGSTVSLLDYIKSDWAKTLKAKRAKVLEGHKTAIPDAEAYEAVIVGRSNEGYESFIEGHPEADWILLDREITMSLAKDTYRSKVDSALAEGGAFEKGIDENADKFKRNVLSVIAVNGKAPYIYGANLKLARLLSGKYGLLNTIINNTVDVLTVEAGFKDVVIFDIAFIPAVVSRIVEAGRLVAMAVEAGKPDDFINNKILAKVNPKLKDIADRVVKEGYTLTIEIAKNADKNRYGVHVVIDTAST